MKKRKHSEYFDDASDDGGAVNVKLYRQKKLCAQRITHGRKGLYDALKLAAGFERQKSSRRKKTAASNKDAAVLARIESEYQVLKSLNLAGASESHLYKTIQKVKSIATHPALPSAVQNPPKLAHDAATLNVLARLYKANPVRKIVDEVIEDLKSILENQATSRVTRDMQDTVRQRGAATEGEDTEFLSDDSSQAGAGKDTLGDVLEDESDAFGELEARIVGSSDEESVEQSDLDLSESDALAPRTMLREISEKKSKALAPPIASTFLPSLSMGGYISGSESEAEDLDVAPRKNRRGQRARQQIWEKKYGTKAKHLTGKQGESRDQGWDPKRGATSEEGKADRRGRGGKFSHAQRSGKPKGTDANSIEVKPRKPTKKDDSGKLHPSWEAAKLAKEKKQSADFAGRKISFD